MKHMTLIKTENINSKEIRVTIHIPEQPKNTQQKINAIYDLLTKEVA